MAAQDPDGVELDAWRVDEHRYLDLPREYDSRRKIYDLVILVDARPLGK